MPRFLPKPFRKREQVLTVLATVFALATVVLSPFAGYGAVFAYIFYTAIGTFVFLIVGGRARIFLTALFCFLSYFGLLGATMLYAYRQERNAFNSKLLILSLIMLFVCVCVPVGIGWLITWFTAHDPNDA